MNYKMKTFLSFFLFFTLYKQTLIFFFFFSGRYYFKFTSPSPDVKIKASIAYEYGMCSMSDIL